MLNFFPDDLRGEIVTCHHKITTWFYTAFLIISFNATLTGFLMCPIRYFFIC